MNLALNIKYTISESRMTVKGLPSNFMLLSNIEKQILFKTLCIFFQNVIANHEIRKQTSDCSSNLSHGIYAVMS